MASAVLNRPITIPPESIAARKYAGLDKKTVDAFIEPLKQAQKIKRFQNDYHVLEEAEKPSLYDHIIGGIDLAKKAIFNNVQGAQKFIEDFNRAYLVHDFGELIIEFSTLFGRTNHKENHSFNSQERHKLERNIAELVFKCVKRQIDKSSDQSYFQTFFGAAKKTVDSIETGFQDKVAEAKDQAETLFNQASNWSADVKKSFKGFVDEWMRYFDLSQAQDNVQTSFLANLVKVVDKLEGQRAAERIHNKDTLASDIYFAKQKIENYLKPFVSLKNCTEVKELEQKAAEAKASQSELESEDKAKLRILENLDTVIRLQFQHDNTSLNTEGVALIFPYTQGTYQEVYRDLHDRMTS